MTRGKYYIISETTEDRFDEVDSLDEALRIARDLMKDSQAGDPVSIEHNGRVIRQLVLTPEGEVEEAPYTRVSGRERVLKWNEEDEPEPETVRAAVKKKLDEVFPKLEGVPMLLKPLLEISPSGP